MLPTICELLGQPLPNRPLDGISLVDMIDGKMKARPRPMAFWSFSTAARGKEPYIDPELQKGTTPLVKLAAEFPRATLRTTITLPLRRKTTRANDTNMSVRRCLFPSINPHSNLLRPTTSLDRKDLFDKVSSDSVHHIVQVHYRIAVWDDQFKRIADGVAA